MTDQQIIELIRTKRQQKAFVKLYSHFGLVRNMIKERGGNKEDAQDIFQEALIIFCRKCEDAGFMLTSAISTYLFSIAKYLWNDELKRRNRSKIEVDETNEEMNWEELILEEKKYKKAESVLGELGAKCLELLKLFYMEDRSMKEIAKKMEMSSEKIAKNQKYKCLERAREKYRQL